MRRILSLLAASLAATSAIAQQTTVSWENQGRTRHYIQYVPASYSAAAPVPLVIAMHGLGDSNTNFLNIGMNAVADTANFIVVYPQGLRSFNPLLASFFGPDSLTAWDSGAGAFGLTLSPGVSDVSFINALIDTVSAHYSIDQSRIYATGFSMGGFLTNRLACELPRIAAIASVAGTVGNLIDCQPGRVVPVCHFHGTADVQVGYGLPDGSSANLLGMDVDAWFDFWAQNNGCTQTVADGPLPNTANDGYTVDYKEQGGCNGGSRVARYKVHGAEHIWMGPANDISYSKQIWRFFRGASPATVGVDEAAARAPLSIYPSPASDRVHVDGLSGIIAAEVCALDGRVVLSIPGAHMQHGVDVSSLPSGAYLLRVTTGNGVVAGRFARH